MHQQKVAVFTTSKDIISRIRKIIPQAIAEVHHVDHDCHEVMSGITLALVDGKWKNMKDLLGKLAGKAVYTVLVDDEKHLGDTVPEELSQGLVDDLLLMPIRPIELLGKIKHAAHLMQVSELFSVNNDVKTLVEKFEEDIRTARAIQRTLIPEKFAPVHGLKVNHKYLSGLKSGGDYLDFFEFEDKTHVGILMSDSSGYGLSSAFMSVILRLAVKLSKDEVRKPTATVAKIFEELQLTMKPKENLSIFYGVLNRKTFEMTYTCAGNIHFVHQSRDTGSYDDRICKMSPLAKEGSFDLIDHKVQLMPNDRMVVFSDGFAETFENAAAIKKAFGTVVDGEPIELVNEMVYRVKKTLEAEDDMPAQDASVMVIDVEKRAMRLAK